MSFTKPFWRRHPVPSSRRGAPPSCPNIVPKHPAFSVSSSPATHFQNKRKKLQTNPSVHILQVQRKLLLKLSELTQIERERLAVEKEILAIKKAKQDRSHDVHVVGDEAYFNL